MATQYKGSKPCAGCGKSGTESRRISADDICFNCRDLLKLGKAAVAQSTVGFVRVRVFYISQYCGKNRVCDTLNKSFFALVKSLHNASAQVGGDLLCLGQFSTIGSVDATVTEAQSIALQSLYDNLKDGLAAVYSSGKAEGQNLLFSLNNGTITMDTFTEKLKL